jgi:hypothetical protein
MGLLLHFVLPAPKDFTCSQPTVPVLLVQHNVQAAQVLKFVRHVLMVITWLLTTELTRDSVKLVVITVRPVKLLGDCVLHALMELL